MAPDDRLREVLARPDLRLASCQSPWAHVSKYAFAASLLSAEGAKVGMLFGVEGEYLVRRSEPHMVVMVDLDIPGAVLDMTDDENLQLFDTGLQELTGSWLYDPNPATQRLGKAAYDCGRVAAILFASATSKGQEPESNLVVFRDRLENLPGASMHPVDPANHLPNTVTRIGRPRRRYPARS